MPFHLQKIIKPISLVTCHTMLVPPAGFGIAETGVYVALYADPINYGFLKTLELKSVLLLDAETPSPQFYSFLDDSNIQLYQVSNRTQTESSEYQRSVIYIRNDAGLTQTKADSWMVFTRSLISRIFSIVLDKTTHNLLVVDLLVVVISLLRKIEKWNYANLINEYRLYANKNRTYHIENFLEVIRIELVPADKQPKTVSTTSVQSPRDLRLSLLLPAGVLMARKSSLASIWSGSHVQTPEDSYGSQNSYDNSYRSGNADLYRSGALDTPRLSFSEHQDVSSLPQIPSTLLKLVRSRKKERSDDLFAGIDTPESQPSLLSQELAHLSLKEPKKELLPALEVASEEEEDADLLQYYSAFYKLSLKNLYGINNKVKIQLPPEENLPEWFKVQRDMWISEYLELC